jgi:hypothetical protein
MLFFGGGLGLEQFDLGGSSGPISWYLSFFPSGDLCFGEAEF